MTTFCTYHFLLVRRQTPIVFLHAPIESNNCSKCRVLSAKTLVEGDTGLVKRVL